MWAVCVCVSVGFRWGGREWDAFVLNVLAKHDRWKRGMVAEDCWLTADRYGCSAILEKVSFHRPIHLSLALAMTGPPFLSLFPLRFARLLRLLDGSSNSNSTQSNITYGLIIFFFSPSLLLNLALLSWIRLSLSLSIQVTGKTRWHRLDVVLAAF